MPPAQSLGTISSPCLTTRPSWVDRLLDGFLVTLRLLALSGLLATAIGTVLAAMRVSPIAPLRAFGTSYVNVFRNTPLVVLFLIAVVGLPAVGVLQGSFFSRAVACAVGLHGGVRVRVPALRHQHGRPGPGRGRSVDRHDVRADRFASSSSRKPSGP